MSVPNTTYRVLVEKLGAQDPSQFIGNEGEVFYDPNSPILKLSNGTTPGGVSIGGTGGTANTGNITFSAERIIGDTSDGFPLGVIQITPSLNIQGFGNFVDNGQYVNVYPTIGDDAPHIHITAGTLSTTSPYYNESTGYYKGDLYLGDDSNYVSISGNGAIEMYSNPSNGSITIDGGNTTDGKIRIYQNGFYADAKTGGLDFNSDAGIAKPYNAYVGQGTTDGVIYNSQLYGLNTFSVKATIQCIGDGGGVQLSELLLIRQPESTNVFINEIGRVTNRASNDAHCAFTATYNTDYDVISIIVDTTSSPDSGGWSFMTLATEIRRFVD